ncbi:MAG: response regulator [Pirellulaceae bacterium]
MNDRKTVYVVDDDPTACQSLRAIVESLSYKCEAYSDWEEFPALDSLQRPGCLILDHTLEATTNGLEILRRNSQNPNFITTIALTGYANAALAVAYMRAGASRLLEKPINGDVLSNAIIEAVNSDRDRVAKFERLKLLLGNYRMLTERQKLVVEELLSGSLNKQIATKLEFSKRTIEMERGRIFQAFEVDCAVELAILMTELTQLLEHFDLSKDTQWVRSDEEPIVRIDSERRSPKQPVSDRARQADGAPTVREFG